MLWFIGLGVSGIKSISEDIRKVIEDSDIVYLESFTSPISKSHEEKIKSLVRGDFKIAKRWFVEDGQEILRNAQTKKISLLSYGDPYIATTHIELRTRAEIEKIETRTIHSSSVLTSLVGESGLQYYKIGRIATIMNDEKSLLTPYNIIYKNLLQGNHSILLLEYNQDQDFFLDPKNAIGRLLDVEKEQRRNVLSDETYAIITSRIGFDSQKIISGKFSSLIKTDFGEPPHSIIITGKLHFTESDAVNVLTKCLDKPIDNSSKIRKISVQMIKKYVPMVKDALEEIEPHYKNSAEFKDVIENAKLYIKDSEIFLEQGKDELAILSIGYADGLVDSLRIAKGLDPKM